MRVQKLDYRFIGGAVVVGRHLEVPQKEVGLHLFITRNSTYRIIINVSLSLPHVAHHKNEQKYDVSMENAMRNNNVIQS